jgi:hypothetical protein
VQLSEFNSWMPSRPRKDARFSSFDHLVNNDEHVRKTSRPSVVGHEVDDELEFRRFANAIRRKAPCTETEPD